MLTWLAMLVLMFGAVFGLSCGDTPSSQPLGQVDDARIRAELEGRSFRQFHPHVDGDPRKGVIIDFKGGVSLWAQYAEGAHAENEWEIVAREYRIEDEGGASEIAIYFDTPMTFQQFPTACEGCISASGVSISVREVFDGERIAFRINDPEDVLPLPFPVFESWTEFREDEYVD